MTREDAAKTAEVAFAGAAGLTRNLSVQVVPVGGVGAPAIYNNLAAIVTRVPAARVDGTTVQPNDELVRLRVASLPVGVVLKPGDYFTGYPDGFQRDVITAHLEAGEAVWVCVVRRVFA
jgi:hypothetical protein